MSRLGIDVGPERLHAVLTRGSRIIWRGATPVAIRESLADAIERLLSPMPLHGLARRRIHVDAAIGPSFVQTRVLRGLPTVRNARIIPRLVRENVGALFLRGRSALVLGSIDVREDGTVWAAAFEQHVIQEISSGLQRSGLRLRRAIPAVSAVASLLLEGSFVWSDGRSRTAASTTNGRLGRVRPTTPLSDPGSDPPTIPGELASIGASAWHYAAAYAATQAPRRAPFAWKPERDSRHTKLARRALSLGVAALIAFLGAAALLAPGIRAARFIERSKAELTRLTSTRSATARVEAEFRRVSTLVVTIQRFQADRGGLTLLLGEITRKLPDSTAIVSLRVDSLDGNLVILATHAAAVLPPLVSIGRIASPRLVGSVTSEPGSAHIERATFRFRRARPTSRIRPRDSDVTTRLSSVETR
jgi:hypothetical protein